MLPTLRSRFNMPSIFDEFFGRDFNTGLSEDRANMTIPAVNVLEDHDNFKIEVAAPGLEKRDFKIDLDNNMLSISSEKEFKHEEEKDGKFMRREFAYASFKRSFTLPESVDADKIKANYKEGVLHITIPKREEAKQKPPRQISIS
ncbi:MAG: Hsp20/alpha crystallin family protein [Bacteroidetes bacterium]|nr:MAG: Hsp20/alpha crystallin family protein [Bacteroidota bacterium]